MGMLVTDDIRRYRSYLSESITSYNTQVQDQLRHWTEPRRTRYRRDLVAESVMKLKVTTRAMGAALREWFRWMAFTMALGFTLMALPKRPKPGAAAPVDAH